MSTATANGHVVTLDELASAKKLPADWLERELGLRDLPNGQGVGIPYYDAAGNEVAIKRRTKPSARDGSFWPKGQPLRAYGEWRLDRVARLQFAVLVEGESDCWALWHHGYAALGVPGSNGTKVIQAEHLESAERVYVHVEPDNGGEIFLAGCLARLKAIGFRGEVLALRLDGVKDPADLHAKHGDGFRALFGRAVDAAAKAVGDGFCEKVNSVPGEKKSRPEPHEWGVPVRLDVVPEAHPFPVHVLPLKLRPLVDEAAAAMNIPPDFVAVPMIALAAGAIGNAVHLSVSEGHTQPPIIYAAVVGNPGTCKTAPLKMLRKPLDDEQRRRLEQWKEDHAAWKKRQKERERRARQKDAPADVSTDGDHCPVLKRCIVSDCTTESLGLTLTENPRGLVMVRDELVGLVTGMNQYKGGGKGQDRQVYLALWSGDTVIIDRKSDKSRDGAPLFVSDPALSIIGNLQPAVLNQLLGDGPRHAQPVDDGFTDRFLLTYPRELKARGETWQGISEEARQAWAEVVGGLLSREMVTESNGDPRPYYKQLTDCGRTAWKRFTERHAAELNDDDFPPHLAGPWSKLRGYCARLALVLHILRLECGETISPNVDGESVEHATRLTDYFKSHTRKAYAAMGMDPKTKDAARIVRWLIQAEKKQTVSKRDLHAEVFGGSRKSGDLDPVLRLLEEFGYVRPTKAEAKEGAGRKPGPVFEVNPLIFSSPGTEFTFSQNSVSGDADEGVADQ